MPQGERRDIVLRWGGKAGARQEIAFSGTRASLGLEELPQGERRETVLRRGGVRAAAAA